MFEALAGPLLSVLFLFWSEPYVLVIEKLDLSCNLCQNCCNSDRSRRGAYGACPLLFLDQNEARRAKKNIFETGPLLISESGWPDPPSPLIWWSGSATVQYWFSLDETLVSRDEMLISGMRHLSFEKWDEIGTCNILLSSTVELHLQFQVQWKDGIH